MAGNYAMVTERRWSPLLSACESTPGARTSPPLCPSSAELRMHFPDPDTISPEQFELTTKRWFESFAERIDEFDAQHREIIAGADGEFEIDVSVRFTAFGGARFLVLCECKKHKNPIKREVVQVLNDRKRSIGAHKGFVVSTASFQSGAEDYASRNGIALVQLVNGALRYVQMSARREMPNIPADADQYAGIFSFPTKRGHCIPSIITSDLTYFLEEILQAPDEPGAGP